MNFGDAELFEKNDLRLQNDCFEELDMIPTVAKTLLQNGKNESLQKGTDQKDNSDVIISNEKLFNARVQDLMSEESSEDNLNSPMNDNDVFDESSHIFCVSPSFVAKKKWRNVL